MPARPTQPGLGRRQFGLGVVDATHEPLPGQDADSRRPTHQTHRVRPTRPAPPPRTARPARLPQARRPAPRSASAGNQPTPPEPTAVRAVPPRPGHATLAARTRRRGPRPGMPAATPPAAGHVGHSPARPSGARARPTDAAGRRPHARAGRRPSPWTPDAAARALPEAPAADARGIRPGKRCSGPAPPTDTAVRRSLAGARRPARVPGRRSTREQQARLRLRGHGRSAASRARIPADARRRHGRAGRAGGRPTRAGAAGPGPPGRQQGVSASDALSSAGSPARGINPARTSGRSRPWHGLRGIRSARGPRPPGVPGQRDPARRPPAPAPAPASPCRRPHGRPSVRRSAPAGPQAPRQAEVPCRRARASRCGPPSPPPPGPRDRPDRPA